MDVKILKNIAKLARFLIIFVFVPALSADSFKDAIELHSTETKKAVLKKIPSSVSSFVAWSKGSWNLSGKSLLALSKHGNKKTGLTQGVMKKNFIAASWNNKSTTICKVGGAPLDLPSILDSTSSLVMENHALVTHEIPCDFHLSFIELVSSVLSEKLSIQFGRTGRGMPALGFLWNMATGWSGLLQGGKGLRLDQKSQRKVSIHCAKHPYTIKIHNSALSNTSLPGIGVQANEKMHAFNLECRMKSHLLNHGVSGILPYKELVEKNPYPA